MTGQKEVIRELDSPDQRSQECADREVFCA